MRTIDLVRASVSLKRGFEKCHIVFAVTKSPQGVSEPNPKGGPQQGISPSREHQEGICMRGYRGFEVRRALFPLSEDPKGVPKTTLHRCPPPLIVGRKRI